MSKGVNLNVYVHRTAEKNIRQKKVLMFHQ